MATVRTAVKGRDFEPGIPALRPARLGENAGRRLLFLASVLSLAVVASLLILKLAPAPFFWVPVTWAVALFAAMVDSRGKWLRPILFNLGFLACLMAGVEAYFIAHQYTPPMFSDGFRIHDDVLGWAPTKGMVVHAFKSGPEGIFHHPKGVLFDVTYTIDSNGLRVADPRRTDALADTILFFGCSFAFGEGLKDSDTLPYQLGTLSGGRYRVFNFGFEGYGPEQMLAAIEHGIVRRVVKSTPQYAYYIAIPNHVWRVAGKTAWGGHAPRYMLDADGTLREAGHFENREPLALRLGLGRRVSGQLNKSAAWRMLSMGDSRVNDDDIRLYFAVVRRSQELLRAEYPGIQFRVLLWPNQNVSQQQSTYEKLQDGFRHIGIPFDRVEDILPGYQNNRIPYILGAADHHPNALANRLLAQHILNEVSGQG